MTLYSPVDGKIRNYNIDASVDGYDPLSQDCIRGSWLEPDKDEAWASCGMITACRPKTTCSATSDRSAVPLAGAPSWR